MENHILATNSLLALENKTLTYTILTQTAFAFIRQYTCYNAILFLSERCGVSPPTTTHTIHFEIKFLPFTGGNLILPFSSQEEILYNNKISGEGMFHLENIFILYTVLGLIKQCIHIIIHNGQVSLIRWQYLSLGTYIF